MKKGTLLFLMVSSFILSSCQNKEQHHHRQKKLVHAKIQADSQAQKLKIKQLKSAVVLLRENIDGVLHHKEKRHVWTANELVDALLSVTKKTNHSGITYRKDKVTKPWQIVLIPNEAQKSILIKAYAVNIDSPVIVDTIHLVTYKGL